jgi:hypothetical protein
MTAAIASINPLTNQWNRSTFVKWSSQNLLSNPTSYIPVPRIHPYLLIYPKPDRSEAREMIDTVSSIKWTTNQAKQTNVRQYSIMFKITPSKSQWWIFRSGDADCRSRSEHYDLRWTGARRLNKQTRFRSIHLELMTMWNNFPVPSTVFNRCCFQGHYPHSNCREWKFHLSFQREYSRLWGCCSSFDSLLQVHIELCPQNTIKGWAVIVQKIPLICWLQPFWRFKDWLWMHSNPRKLHFRKITYL